MIRRGGGAPKATRILVGGRGRRGPPMGCTRGGGAPRIVRLVSLAFWMVVASTGCEPAPADAQQPRRTLVAVFAHPDDERIVGPLLARYAREGHDVHLVIATDGRLGVTDHAGIPPGDSLSRVRAGEARCAARELGIHPPVLLDLPDAGLSSFASLTRLRDEARRIFRELEPDAIVGFGPEGGTGHPDHRLVGAVVTEIVQSGGDGIPHGLYYASLPAKRMEDAPPARPEVTAVPREHLSVTVAFEAADFEAARRAFACHASQYTPEQMDAIMRYLAHGYAGAVHLRPWSGGAERRTTVFDP